jgi:hypothetical protein
MANTESYHIADEPNPGPMAHLTVNPIWPLFGVMFGGAWLSWPWFLFNSFAMGSPTRRRETLWCLGSFVVSALLFAVIVFLAETMGQTAIPYLLMGLTIWKLGVSYRLYTLQARPFELHQYYGGPVRNGMWVVAAGFFLGRRYLLPPLSESLPILGVILR